jgi:hypothetical protein
MNVILIVGAKGGVGTTMVAQELTRVGKTLAVDAADGALAARLGRATWHLTCEIYAATGAWRATLIEQALKKRVTLLFAVENLVTGSGAVAPWEFVRDVARRVPVVIDGGLEPPAEVDALVTQAVIVTQLDNPLAQWHVAQLQQRYPGARMIAGTRQAAAELASQLFSGVQTP